MAARDQQGCAQKNQSGRAFCFPNRYGVDVSGEIGAAITSVWKPAQRPAIVNGGLTLRTRGDFYLHNLPTLSVVCPCLAGVW